MADRAIEEAAEEEISPEAFLALLGATVRELRARRGMTRKILARESGLSQRYLAELEAGRGNISVLLLRQLAKALGVTLQRLVSHEHDPSSELSPIVELLQAASPADLLRVRQALSVRAGQAPEAERRRRIALIGLRGAGKSTLGRLLAERLACRFIELDKEIEVAAGVPLAAVFDLYGQAGFRRLERRSLDRIVAAHEAAVIAAGGGLVSDHATYEKLLANCFTVWVKASPGEHMERVISQGDRRPMANNREAMSDLNAILRSREPLYARADAQLDTSGKDVAECVEELAALVA